MARPLIIKRPKELGWLGQVAIVVVFVAPILGFIWCWAKVGNVHFEQPQLNLAAHVLLVLLPLIWAGVICSSPMEFTKTEEIVLGRSSYFRQFPVDWWMSLMTLAAPLFAAVTLGYEFFTHYLVHPESLATSPIKALAIMGTTLALGIFCAAILTGSSEPRALVSDEGLRNGISVFYPWADIARVRRRGLLYVIYHKINPALPATCFEVRDPEARSVLEQFLSAKQITISDTTHPQYTLVRIGVFASFIAFLSGCFWLRLNTSIPLLWITVGAFMVGIVFTVLIEKIRGVSNYQKYQPVIEPPSLHDAPPPEKCS
jgi:hypothetical protein